MILIAKWDLDEWDIKACKQCYALGRLSGEVTDLHSADPQYHNNCCKRFISHENIQAPAGTKSNVFLQGGRASDALICEMEGKQSRVWNSIEIHEAYTDYGGSKLS